MALKRNFNQLETFSMSSMTDVIFLLLIFFMVTSTIIFPSAIDVNLPQSDAQSQEKPLTEIYLDRDAKLYIVTDKNDSSALLNTPRPVDIADLDKELAAIHALDSTRSVAILGDSLADYGKVVRILDAVSKQNLRVVLSTRATSVTIPDSQSTIPNP